MYVITSLQKSQYNLQIWTTNRFKMSNKTLIIEALQQKVETLNFWDDFFST